MSPGTLTLSFLMLTAAAPPNGLEPLNIRNFRIPIHINEPQRAKIKELILYSSTDQGATWQQAGAATPDKEEFVYYAPADGVYWFTIQVVNPQGQREPPDIFHSPPRQKVLVDTIKPLVRITSAERQGDEVVVSWDIQEANPELSTLKLDYRPADGPSFLWNPAPVSPALNGQSRFRVAGPGPLLVRLQMTDQVGNQGSDQKDIKGTTPVAPSIETTRTTPAPAIPLPSASNAVAAAPAPVAVAASPAPEAPRPQAPPPAPVFDASRAPTGLPNFEPTAPVQPASLTQPDPRNTPDRAWSPASSSASSADGAGRFAATLGARWPHATLPLQITNTTQVTLDYRVDNVGPSGVGSVELFLSEDDGRSWRRYAVDEDCKPPMTVNLPGEGVFGLRLVVSSRAGLGRRPPQSGDLPQMRIEVDTSPPTVKLASVRPDPQRRDALILTWNASDHNLAANPITLQWAERPDGTWQTIAQEMTNSGSYSWQLTPNLPYRVYLRVEARDTAGNVSRDETPDPVLIDLHEPEGQLLGLQGNVRRP